MSLADRPAVGPSGIWAAVLLPVSPAGTIDWTAVEGEVAALAASGVAGIYTNGTAGEFHTQTEAEFDRLSETVAATADRFDLAFQVGVSHTNPRVSRERLARIAGLHPSAVQFILPDWWPPSSAEVRDFVVGLAETAPTIPLVLYNPPHAKRQLDIAEVAALRAAVPSLVGAKLPGGDGGWYAAVREKLPGFAVFIPGHDAASGRLVGAAGSYSNVACLSPVGAVKWWDLVERDATAALDLEERIKAFLADEVLPLRRTHDLSDAALDKAMAAAGALGTGWTFPALALPRCARRRGGTNRQRGAGAAAGAVRMTNAVSDTRPIRRNGLKGLGRLPRRLSLHGRRQSGSYRRNAPRCRGRQPCPEALRHWGPGRLRAMPGGRA